MSDKSSASDKSYVPPLVWAPEQANGGAFASINKPTAGATHQQTLPRGDACSAVVFLGDTQWYESIDHAGRADPGGYCC